MKINFKEWLLTEMPHLRIENCPTGNLCFIDLNVEKWKMDDGAGLSGNWRNFNMSKPFIARWKDGWIVSDGYGSETKFVKEQPMGDYQELPAGWFDYAEILDSKGMQIKAPRFDYQDYWADDKATQEV